MAKSFINFNSDEIISRYFKDNKKPITLTSEQEKDLALRIQNGDKKAIDELVKANLKFVVTIAKEYINQGLPLSDLISEGNYGLIKAAHKFDVTKGFKFISYAVWWIRQSILFSLNENSRIIRLPTNVINKIQHLKLDVEKFEHEHEREPMYDEVLNINGDSIIKVSNASLCLNDSINEDGDELYNIIEDKTLRPDDDYYDVNYEVKTELKGLLDSLDERERKIIECYFGLNGDSEPMTLEVIGEMFNLSRERVRQIKHKALRKLRHNSDNLFETL